MSPYHGVRPLHRDETGSMLIELVIAMSFLAIAVGALMALYASTQIDMRHAATEGTALTIADRQIEAYKSLPYDSIKLDSSTIPSGSDPYVSASSSDSTIPSSSGQLTGATASGSCTNSTDVVTGCATQTWTGPDGRFYRVDTYIVSVTPSGGRAVKKIVVITRQIVSGTVGAKIWGRATSEFDQSNPPQ